MQRSLDCWQEPDLINPSWFLLHLLSPVVLFGFEGSRAHLQCQCWHGPLRQTTKAQRQTHSQFAGNVALSDLSHCFSQMMMICVTSQGSRRSETASLLFFFVESQCSLMTVGFLMMQRGIASHHH